MRTVALLSILLLLAYSARCQTIRLSKPQAARILDSLAVLPLVRQEAAAWRATAGQYARAVGQLTAADSLRVGAYERERRAADGLSRLLSNETAKTTAWRRKAHRRSLANVVLVGVAGGLGYLLLKP